MPTIKLPTIKKPTIKELAELIRNIKATIHDDSRAYDESDIPGTQLTIGYNSENGDWSYQTGDNSYAGAAYLYRSWIVVDIHRRSNSREIAREILEQFIVGEEP
jgi:hypothetical protein